MTGTKRFVCDRPRRPRYVPIIHGERDPVFVHYPVLTPDNGVIMCTTEADQYRVAYELNRLHGELEALREELRISRQSEKEAWRYEPELRAERDALQTKVAELMFGAHLTHGVESLLAAIDAEDAARAAWDECGCGTPEFDQWTRATDLRRMHATWVRIVATEFRRRTTKQEESV